MTQLEIIYTIILWIIYGVFNAYQHDFYKYEDDGTEALFTFLNVVLAPIALIIRIIRGVFYWKGSYYD